MSRKVWDGTWLAIYLIYLHKCKIDLAFIRHMKRSLQCITVEVEVQLLKWRISRKKRTILEESQKQWRENLYVMIEKV
jgi:hypothetical protein